MLHRVSRRDAVDGEARSGENRPTESHEELHNHPQDLHSSTAALVVSACVTHTRSQVVGIIWLIVLVSAVFDVRFVLVFAVGDASSMYRDCAQPPSDQDQKQSIR